MAEYIEREALLAHLRKCKETSTGSGLIAAVITAIQSFVEGMPLADVAPVVRCKDCKWFADNNDGEWYGCQMFQVVWITPEDAPKPDDFCSYGERKDGGSDE